LQRSPARKKKNDMWNYLPFEISEDSTENSKNKHSPKEFKLTSFSVYCLPQVPKPGKFQFHEYDFFCCPAAVQNTGRH
jgi:hypothetical protein